MLQPRQLHVGLATALVAMSSVFLGLWALGGDLQEPLIAEGGPIEALTVVFWCAAFGLSVLSLRLVRRELRSGLFVFIPLLCLVGAMEELSFGMNTLVDESAYPVILGVRMDAIHDLNQLALKVLNELDLSVSRTLVVMSIVLALLGVLLRRQLRRAALHVLDHTPLLYAAAAFSLALVALGLDALYDFTHQLPPVFQFVEEVLELNAAFTMVMASSADLLLHPRSPIHDQATPTPVLASDSELDSAR